MSRWKHTSQQESQRSLIPEREETAVAGPDESPRLVWGVRRKVATAVLAAVSVLLGCYAIFGHDGLIAYQQKRHQSSELQRQILNMQKENDRLAQQNHRLQNDPDTIEYEARQQMHYTRPGEVIYTLPEAPGSTPSNQK